MGNGVGSATLKLFLLFIAPPFQFFKNQYMTRRTAIVFLITALSVTSLPAQPSPQIREALTELTTFYKKRAKARKVVGSSLAIIRDKEQIYRSNFGLANLETKESIDNQTIYHWASVTKTFTGIAIMQLRDRGKLSLDDPVTKYIPELRKVHNEYGSMDEITIRQLMTHSAGFRNPTWPWGGDKDWHPHEPQHWEQLVAMFPYTEIKFNPGSQWSYSNPGIIFLGRIIELLTKDDYEYYVAKNILQPLQMDSSYFDKTPYHLVDKLAQSYYLQEDDSYEKARFDLNTGVTVSNGGLSAPIGDMTKYLNFLLGNGHPEDYEHVLKRSSINEMFEPQIAITSKTEINISARQMGLCFFVGDMNGTHLVGHSGDQNGFISHIYLAPNKNAAYVVAYNTWGQTRELDRELKQYITKNIFSEF